MSLGKTVRCHKCGCIREYPYSFAKGEIIQKIRELGWRYEKKKKKEIFICRSCTKRI